jgi:hypothetical protein
MLRAEASELESSTPFVQVNLDKRGQSPNLVKNHSHLFEEEAAILDFVPKI